MSRRVPDRPRRFAAIDIGTNTLRSVIVEADGADEFRVLDTEKVPNRLGAGLTRTGRLSTEARRRTLEGLRYLKEIAEGHGCSTIRVVGTSAMRDAADGSEFAEEIRRVLALDVRVINGEEEARLALRSALHNFDLREERIALVDVGGGSAEVVLSVGPLVETVSSLPLGAVRLTERYVETDPPGPAAIKRMRARVRSLLEPAVRGSPRGVRIVASGGSATSMARMILNLRGSGGAKAHGAEISRSAVEHLYDLLRGMDAAGRRKLKGLSPDRVDIILAGVLVLRETMRALEANRMLINEGGIREGLVLEMIEESFGRPRSGAENRSSPIESALRFARACRYEPKHAETVREFGLALFDATAPLHSLGSRERMALELAAILHDVGYFIDYPRHHRHSYHLISHAGLKGLDRRTLEIVALVARYHRRSMPKRSHREYARLSRRDRHTVEWLAGLLRLADGIDRGHAQRVRSLRVAVGPEEIRIGLVADERVDLEIWGAERKRDLLAAVSKRSVILHQVRASRRARPAGSGVPASGRPR